MTHTYLVTDDDGNPVGVLDALLIVEHGTRLVADLVAAADDSDRCCDLVADLQATLGDVAYRYACTSALLTMTADVLAPTLKIVYALKAAYDDADQRREPTSTIEREERQ